MGGRVTIQTPRQPWELIQIGNCGSPIETERGWLVLTHGVGSMRSYGIGVMLLDLEDPTKLIGELADPLITPTEAERDGYVPNVVYTCGALAVGDRLVVPYGSADSFVGFGRGGPARAARSAHVAVAVEPRNWYQERRVAVRIAMLGPVAWRTPPVAYGPWELVVSTLCEGLVARGVDVTLFATLDSQTSATLDGVCPQPYGENPAMDGRVWEALHVAHCLERSGEFDLVHNNLDWLPLAMSGAVPGPDADHDPRLQRPPDPARVPALDVGVRVHFGR